MLKSIIFLSLLVRVEFLPETARFVLNRRLVTFFEYFAVMEVTLSGSLYIHRIDYGHINSLLRT